MTTKLIALVALAGIALADGTTKDITAGATFEVADDAALDLIAKGDAKLPDADQPPAVKSKPVKVRLLVDSDFGKVNDVVTITAAEAKAAEANGIADSAKDAVAYALTLPQNSA